MFTIKNKATKLKNHGDEFYTNPEKRKQTNLENWGVEWVWQSKEVIEKSKETKLEIHGDENYVNPKKAKETKLERWGDENYNNVEQNKATKLKNHGDENYNNREKFLITMEGKWEKCVEKREQTKLDLYDNKNYNNREKFIETMDGNWDERNKKSIETNLKIFGVEHHMQNVEVFNKQQKSAFLLKEYLLPSSKVIKVQGYENIALDVLLKYYDESDLVIMDKDIENKIGKIYYEWKDGTSHRYYPDIYIISENRIIEVKSKYTLINQIEKNKLKMNGCFDYDLNFCFMVFNDKKQLLTKEEIKELV